MAAEGAETTSGPRMASVLFTDVVGSTALRQRLGEDVADRLQRTHDRLLGEAVAAAGGRVVKGVGDGIMAVFDAATDAVGAAVRIQQAVEAHRRTEPELGFEVRVGLSAGDVTISDGDVLGTVVVEAARLCDAARAGQILAADVVRVLTRGRGEQTFEPVGTLDLKGLEGSVAACQVAWDPAPPAHDGLAFPSLLAPTAGTDYVGRPDLRARLDDVWADVVSGGGSRAVLLAGEPGVGKTRTAAETARAAHGEGAMVLYGRCDEALSTPYQPFVEALDWQTRHDITLPLGRLAGELVRLLPDLSDRVEGLDAPVVSDSAVEQHRLFEATAAWLAEASRETGAVLVVDDLHWAGTPTLALLGHVLRAARADPHARLLVIGTFRDTEVDRGHPLTVALGELRRIEAVERLPVAPLDAAEVIALVEAAAGHELDAAGRRLADQVFAQTEGNPFFVAEVLRHLIETGSVRLVEGRWQVTDPGGAIVPESIQDVVARRLARLSHPANEVLRTAAVVGRDVDVDVLTALARDTDTVLDALDEALRARLVEETGPETVRFSHALVRAILYEQLSGPRRRRAHQRVLGVLERLHPADVEALAHHAVQAGPDADGGREPAILHSVAAGDQALARRAHADAADWYTQALDLATHHPPDDASLVLRARCGLGQAQRALGEPASRDTLLDAGRQALRAGHVDLAVRAAVANTRFTPTIAGAVDVDKVALLEALCAEAGAFPAGDRARVHALLAGELTHDPTQTARRLALADQALHLTSTTEDPGLRAWVQIVTVMATFVPDRAQALARDAGQMVATADQSRDPALQCMARFQAGAARLTVGDVQTARSWIDEADRVGMDAAPVLHWLVEIVRLQWQLYDGDLAGARETNRHASELGQDLREPDAAMGWGAIESGAAWVDGSVATYADIFGAFADQYPANLSWRTTHIEALTRAGRLEEARDLLDAHGLADPGTVPDDWVRLNALARLATAAFEAGWTDVGHAIGTSLAPYRDLWAHYLAFVSGPVELFWGVASAAAGRWDDGVDATRRGRDLLADRGLHSHRPLASWYLARILTGRGHADDLVEARVVAQQGMDAAESMGMGAMADELSGLLTRALA